METKLYDLHFALRGARDPGDQVVIVAADEKSLATLGRWPWPRSVLADLVTALSDGGAKVIAFDILLSEPQVERRAARRRSALASASRRSACRRSAASGRRSAGRWTRSSRRRTTTAGSTEAIRKSGRVVLPTMFEIVPLPPAAAARAFGAAAQVGAGELRPLCRARAVPAAVGERRRRAHRAARRGRPRPRPRQHGRRSRRDHALGGARLRVSRLLLPVARGAGGAAGDGSARRRRQARLRPCPPDGRGRGARGSRASAC